MDKIIIVNYMSDGVLLEAVSLYWDEIKPLIDRLRKAGRYHNVRHVDSGTVSRVGRINETVGG